MSDSTMYMCTNGRCGIAWLREISCKHCQPPKNGTFFLANSTETLPLCDRMQLHSVAEIPDTQHILRDQTPQYAPQDFILLAISGQDAWANFCMLSGNTCALTGEEMSAQQALALPCQGHTVLLSETH